MNNKAMKRVMAMALAGTMVIGSAMTVFADGTAITQNGTATFEGVEPELPAVQAITLPTAASAATFFNYTADPAGLMRKYGDDALKAKLPEAAKDTGIYFATADSKYAADSQALKVTNENARDIDVKVKVEVTSTDYDDMTFATDGTWETTEKDNEIYLAVLEKGADPANIAVVSADKAAELTITVAGKPANYEVNRTVTDGVASYAYAKKTGTLTWEETEFYLTGAINKNAEWKDGTVTAPNIKVTWDYAAHVDGPSLSATSAAKPASGDLVVTVNGLAENETINSTFVQHIGDASDSLGEPYITVSGNKVTFTEGFLVYVTQTRQYDITTSTGKKLTYTITVETD